MTLQNDLIIVALGANMDRVEADREAVLSRAFEALEAAGVLILARSALWRSKAWPDPRQNDYLNAVCLVETGVSPAALLDRLHEIERAFGRLRPAGAARNAARVLDLDLIAYGRIVQAGPPVLPHPRAAERLFVMGPLAQIAPDWVFPGLGETAAALAARADVGRDAAPVSAPLRQGGENPM